MPPWLLSSSRHNSKPRICAVESLLSLPVRDTVNPMVSVSSAASAGEAVSNAAKAVRTSLLMGMTSSQKCAPKSVAKRELSSNGRRFLDAAVDVDQILLGGS